MAYLFQRADRASNVGPMRTGIQVQEAQQIVLDATSRLGSETVSAAAALGRVLCEPVYATRTLPPADCSAMDGYAVRRSDLLEASPEQPGQLQVVFEVAAGDRPERPLESGEAARIFTGAPVPPGADCVVRQEDSDRDGDRVGIFVTPAPGEHIRAAGEDLEIGDLVLEVGAELRPPEIGLLASTGRTLVAVHQRPRVAILSGGDELVEPDRDATAGAIVSSNSHALAAQCREAGAEPLYLGIARDRPEDIEHHLRAGLRADCIVSSAGVSVGEHDHVRQVLEKLGCRLLFWGVQIKPGYPVAFGRFEGDARPLVFGLPGNPVSAMVTFEQLVRPALRKMAGHRACFRPTLRARLAEPLAKKAGRLHFVRVQLERRGEEFWARSTGNQSSGVLTSMNRADGLLIFPAQATVLREGEEVTVLVLHEGFFASDSRGF